MSKHEWVWRMTPFAVGVALGMITRRLFRRSQHQEQIRKMMRETKEIRARYGRN